MYRSCTPVQGYCQTNTISWGDHHPQTPDDSQNNLWVRAKQLYQKLDGLVWLECHTTLFPYRHPHLSLTRPDDSHAAPVLGVDAMANVRRVLCKLVFRPPICGDLPLSFRVLSHTVRWFASYKIQFTGLPLFEKRSMLDTMMRVVCMVMLVILDVILLVPMIPSLGGSVAIRECIRTAVHARCVQNSDSVRFHPMSLAQCLV